MSENTSEEVVRLRVENIIRRELDRANLDCAVQRERADKLAAENTRLRAQALDSDAARLGMEGNLRAAEQRADDAERVNTRLQGELSALGEKDRAAAIREERLREENTRLKEEASRVPVARRDAENGAAKLRDENTRQSEEIAQLKAMVASYTRDNAALREQNTRLDLERWRLWNLAATASDMLREAAEAMDRRGLVGAAKMARDNRRAVLEQAGPEVPPASDKPAIRQPTSVQPPAGPTKAVSLASPSSDKKGGEG